jgi:endonuclease-3 related protein
MNYGERIEKLYQELKSKYGRPKEQWALWCKRPKTAQEKEEVFIGAILTQNTNWKNVVLAINNLKYVKVNSLAAIYRLGRKRTEPLVRPAGFYKIKAGYLFNLAEFAVKSCGGLKKMEKMETGELRRRLLALKGIGPETADSILLYGLARPVFVIDEYTRRLVKARSLAKDLSYGFLQDLFEKNLKKDWRLYQDFHALMVIDGKNKR